MIRKALIAGTVAAGLAITAIHGAPALNRLESSARTFQQYCRTLKSAGDTASPLERLVYSLVLANSKTPHPAHPQPRG